jgi:RND family efflux transporter MFP subunit
MNKFHWNFTNIIVLISFFLVGCESQIKDPRLEDKVVSVINVKKATTQEQGFTGIVTAKVQSNLGFRVSGKIVHRFVDNGQQVKKGQVLMEIDNNDLILSIVAKENIVKSLEARFSLAQVDEKRYKKLLEVNATSQQSYDQAKATFDSIHGELEVAKAQLQIAKNEKQYSLLYADSDGTIVEILSEPGQVINAGQTVIKLAHKGQREASVDLPETIRPELNSKAQAKLFSKDERVSVQLRQLSNSADSQTRTFEARYILSGDIANAPLGSTITVYLDEKNDNNKIEIPLSAITNEGNGTGVWIYNSDFSTISFRKIEIDNLTSETALIKNGLFSEDKIVSLGAHFLHEGQKVRVSNRVFQ